MNTGDALSQQEIQALLAAVDSGRVSMTPGKATDCARAVPYNFRRPTRVSKEQIRALSNIHQELASLLGASLSAMLRSIVELEVETVEQTTYSEYVMALPITTCAFLFEMAPLKGPAVLEISPRVAFVMIDRLLGGQGHGAEVSRDLTEIERVVLERVGARSMVDLAAAWQGLGTFTARLLNLETNAQLMQATAPNEIIVVTTLTITLGDASGRLTVGYPYPSLEPVLSRLGGQRWASFAPRPPAPESRGFITRELTHSSLDVRALLGRAHLTVRDVLSLQPGQLVPLHAKPEHPVRVEVNGVPKFIGRPGTHRHRLAVEVLGPVNERSLDA